MAYIKKKSERKYKITVCNGYKVNGQKRMKAQTIAVPSSVPKRGIQQYVMAEAERIEKKFKYGVEESDQTHFDRYAEAWLNRQKPYFKATTLAGYKRNLEIVCPFIGGIPLAKIRPLTLEEMCEELRKRPGRNGSVKECTVQKYLETVSSVLEDAKKNDIIPFNPAHRVRKRCAEKEKQHIPQKYEMQRLLKIIMDEPILYKAYYTMAIATGLRRGELCALRWEDITGPFEFTIRHSRSYVAGQIVESDTKSHRERIVTIPLGLWELLMALRQQQMLHSGVPDREQPIFTDPDGHVPHPDTFTRHLRKLYKKCGLSEDYHLHTLRHFYATYLLQEGTSKQVAASLLGHADTAFLERTYCHPQDAVKLQAANLMQDLLNSQNPCYVAFMKNKNRKAKKAG
jgi:integrase